MVSLKHSSLSVFILDEPGNRVAMWMDNLAGRRGEHCRDNLGESGIIPDDKRIRLFRFHMMIEPCNGKLSDRTKASIDGEHSLQKRTQTLQCVPRGRNRNVPPVTDGRIMPARRKRTAGDGSIR